MEVVIEELDSLEDLAMALGSNVDTVLKGLYQAIQKQVQIFGDDVFNNIRAMKCLKSDWLVRNAINAYFDEMGSEMSFDEVYTNSVYFNILRGYAFSQMLIMISSVEDKGYKMYLEINYKKQEILYTLI